ncbi:MAG: alanine racemase [Chloroflexi bacterium]|nr:alanine racemase [Chloroflexota bacterium]
MNNSAERPLTSVEVNLDAIAHNVRVLKQHIGPRVDLFAVVKANAYGHGATQVAQAALKHGAARLAVARAAEGIALREAGITAPILVMSYTPPGEVEAAVKNSLTLAVTEPAVADQISARGQALGVPAAVHLKVDTGMGRFGLLPQEVLPFAQHLTSLPALRIEGIFSHFATADSTDKTYTRQQFQTFQDVLAALSAAGITIPLRHIANSAAALDLPEMHLDAVRTGIAMYGLFPSDEILPAVSLQPALALKSHAARVRTLPAGSSISYGRTYITPRAMSVALIPVGYGDGYHRLNSNRGVVLINGQRAPIIGRVCMDQFVVDISHVGPVEVNAEVVLIGPQGAAQITAEEVARWAETINYEVTTSLLPRVPRFYTGG